MNDFDKPTIILGDINLDLLKNCKHPTLEYLQRMRFSQLVETATHQKGGLLDPVFTSHHFNQHIVIINQQGVYYSDHDLIHLKLKLKK